MTATTPLWDVPGQERAVTVLRRAVGRGEVGHAWAFTGPAQVGQEQLVRSLVAALVCVEAPTGCGSCRACVRALRGAHPAGVDLEPNGVMHRVADVRERWLPAAWRSAGEGGWNVLRVVDADRMNDAAANAFLKVLEEPPAHTIWVLDIADPEALPETVLSRCRVLPLRALDRAALHAVARREGLDDDTDRELAVGASLGSLTRLKGLAAPGGLDRLRTHRAIPRALREHGPGYALVAAHALDLEVKERTDAREQERRDEREALDAAHGGALPRSLANELDDGKANDLREVRMATLFAALDDLACWYRDVLVVQAGGDRASLVHIDDADGLAADAEALAPAALLAALDEVLATREALEGNAQPRLALEACFMSLSAWALVRR
jgi:DNA polymerase III subunit delta'